MSWLLASAHPSTRKRERAARQDLVLLGIAEPQLIDGSQRTLDEAGTTVREKGASVPKRECAVPKKSWPQRTASPTPFTAVSA